MGEEEEKAEDKKTEVEDKTEVEVDKEESKKADLTTEEVIDRAVEKLHSIRKESDKDKSNGNASRQWQDVTDQELNYVLANPTQYQQFLAGAIAENNRRFRVSILSEVESAMDIKSAMNEHKDAFDPNTPLGKEIQKIIGKKTNAEILKDAIELASYRQAKSKTGKKDVEKIIDGIKTASAMVPGAETKTNASDPSPGQMKKQEFENMVKSVKLKA